MASTDMQPQAQGNTNFPQRGGFVRADRADDFEPRPVVVPAAATSGTVSEKALAAMEHAKKQHERYLSKLEEHRDRFSESGLAEQQKLFASTDAAKAVDAAAADVRDRAQAAEQEVNSIREGLTTDGDAAAELRASRLWDRTLRTLDSTDGAAVLGVARKMLASAPRRDLGVLLEEIPSYLQAKGLDVDWVDEVIAESVPEFGSARKKLTLAQQALTIAERNQKALRDAYSQGRPVHSLVRSDGYDPDRA